MKRVMILLAVIATTACDSSPTVTVCERDKRPGISVLVVDSAGLAPAPFAGLKVVARSDLYADTADVFRQSVDTTLALVAWERPGTWSVEVTAPDYITWTAENVRVRMKDVCHVETTRIIARLRR